MIPVTYAVLPGLCFDFLPFRPILIVHPETDACVAARH